MKTRGSRFRVLALAVTFGALALTLSGCSWQEVFGLGWPKGITPEAHTNRDLWVWSMIAAFVSFARKAVTASSCAGFGKA